MLVKKSFTETGKETKYGFESLEVGYCLVLDPKEKDLDTFRGVISSYLYQWKKKKGNNWKTAVRTEDGKVCVYRIS